MKVIMPRLLPVTQQADIAKIILLHLLRTTASPLTPPVLAKTTIVIRSGMLFSEGGVPWVCTTLFVL
jgi:hypothetical protein